jgi:EmrB/QacA subfamily drug resistance transporter
VAARQARAGIGRTLAVLALAALSFALAQTAILPAIGDLVTALHTTADGTAWALTGYLVAAAVLTPVFGRLGDMFGKRRLLVISLVTFTAGGVVAALAGSLSLLVVGRVLQGSGGGIFPLCFGIIRDEFPASRRARSIGLISATVGIGGGFGLVVGGALVDVASYRWIFWSGAGLAFITACAAQLFVPESAVRAPGRVDLAGAGLLAVGLTAPLITVSQASRWGWGGPTTIGLIAGGLVVLAGFVEVERRVARPLIHIPTLASPPVLVTNLTTLLMGFAMFGVFLLIPQFAETPHAAGYGFGADATTAGLLLVPGCLMMMLTGPLSGILSDRFGSKLPLILGALAAASGLVMLSVSHGSEGAVIGWVVLLFAGIGLAFAAMPNMIVDAVPAARTGEATGVNALIRTAGGAVGAQVSATILAGTIAAGRLPSARGYGEAFAVSAAVAVAAALAAVLIPGSRHGRRTAPGAPLMIGTLR